MRPADEVALPMAEIVPPLDLKFGDIIDTISDAFFALDAGWG